MRLLIVGTLDGHITAAGKIAMDRGAKVTAAGTVEAALTALRGGQGADLVMVDVTLDIEQLSKAWDPSASTCPSSPAASAPTPAAGRAIKAGAKEYMPLPPDAELIAAVLAGGRGGGRRHRLARSGDDRGAGAGGSGRAGRRQLS